jgi:Family of unknown function (DUF6184)
MNTMKKLGLCALGLGLVSVVGCNKENERDPNLARNEHMPAATGNMTPASRTRSAAEQLAEARCEREQKCSNIGNDKTYSSSQDCLARVQNDWKDDLNARQCPGGINQQQLDECMGQIRAEACSSPFDTLARITECTSAQICIEQP